VFRNIVADVSAWGPSLQNGFVVTVLPLSPSPIPDFLLHLVGHIGSEITGVFVFMGNPSSASASIKRRVSSISCKPRPHTRQFSPSSRQAVLPLQGVNIFINKFFAVDELFTLTPQPLSLRERGAGA
jgi:hypothetical protein